MIDECSRHAPRDEPGQTGAVTLVTEPEAQVLRLRLACSRGAATAGSQGWSERQRAQPLEPAGAPLGATLRCVAPNGAQDISIGYVSRGSAALHPWLHSVAPPGLPRNRNLKG